MSHWSESGSTTPTWSAAAPDTVTWSGATSATPIAARFIHATPKEDATGGVDFDLTFTATNPFYFTSTQPKSFKSSFGEYP